MDGSTLMSTPSNHARIKYTSSKDSAWDSGNPTLCRFAEMCVYMLQNILSQKKILQNSPLQKKPQQNWDLPAAA